MGNNQNKQNVNPRQTNEIIEPRQNLDAEKIQNKNKAVGCGGCFGPQKKTKSNVKRQTITNTKDKSSYLHETGKSSIQVRNQPDAKVDQRLFVDRDRSRLQIIMRRAEPYQILKDSDYFDSETNEKEDLERLRKVYDSCEIANYQTPETEKLQTVQVKTYLFDRNLTKIEV